MTVLLAVIDSLGLCAALVLLLLLLRHLQLAWLARRYCPPVAAAHGATPHILLQIPLYNEARSVEGALLAALALDWPCERLTIQFLDDSTDETGDILAARLARLPAGGPRIEHVRRSERQGFKAGALAAGLAASDAPLIAILDVDFRPPPQWLRLAVSALAGDDRAGFVQFRFEFSNRNLNWMTRAQQLSVDTHFIAEQAGRAARGELFQFNGTGAVWRRVAIEQAGGWSADTLAEDLDLTFRAYASGWHGLLMLDAPVSCEAPADLAAWRGQQARWSSGFMQVAGKALGVLWRSRISLRARLGSTLLLGLQAGLPCFLVAAAAFLLDGMLRGVGGPHAAILAISAAFAGGGAVLITWRPFRRLRRGGIFRYAATLVSIPFMLMLMALANSGAVVTAPFVSRHVFARTPKAGDAREGRQ